MSSPVEEISINTETPAMDHINKIMGGMNAALVRFLPETIINPFDVLIFNKLFTLMGQIQYFSEKQLSQQEKIFFK